MFDKMLAGLSTLNEFHWLRPWWLLSILPALLLAWWLFNHRQEAGSWKNIISADLLPYLLDSEAVQKKHRHHLWSLLFWVACAIALAGPSWTQIPLPIHKQQKPLVILLDLSPSMLAEDIKPNRLTRARLKLTDLLTQRREGTTALIAYANDAHVVTPLTDDTETIISLVPSLHPNIMPAAGSKPIAALQKGLEIMLQAGHQRGDLLLISDGMTPGDADGISSLLKSMAGFRLSVLALGSADGAPIPAKGGGFVKDRQGNIVIAKLDARTLRQLARDNAGRYAKLTANGIDLDILIAGLDTSPNTDTQRLQRTFDTWQDSGFWLVLLTLPIALFGFRRNLIALLLIAPAVFYSEPSDALEWQNLKWKDLWQTPDQQAHQAFKGGDTEKAEQTFNNPNWKGASAYRNENFDAAAQIFGQDVNPTNNYNLANSLARTGQLEEALKSYNEVLTAQPDHQDASFNKKLVEEALKQEQQQQDQNQGQNEEKDQNQEGSENEQESEDRGSESQSSESQSSESKDSEQKNSESKDSDSNNPAENEDPSQTNKADPDADSAKDEQQDQAKPDDQQSEQKPPSLAEQGSEPPSDLSNEERQALEQMLRRVPDDPGGLLRRKFAYEAQLNKQSTNQRQNKQESQRW